MVLIEMLCSEFHELTLPFHIVDGDLCFLRDFLVTSFYTGKYLGVMCFALELTSLFSVTCSTDALPMQTRTLSNTSLKSSSIIILLCTEID